MSLEDDINDDVIGDNVVLCVSNAYEHKYYLGKRFRGLPKQVLDELKIMCVLFTEDVGGILSLMFDKKGNLTFTVTAGESDGFFDEIGSSMKIKQIRKDKKELLESLEKYYQEVYM